MKKMEYKTVNQPIKKLGFGLMRLPMIDKKVDIEQTKIMIDKFMEAGFTYFDTAYSYLEGMSEEVAKECLVDRYPRESFTLATKLPAWLAKNQEEAQEMFWTSLKRTGVEYFDYYLMHNLGGNRTAMFEKYDLWNFIAKRKEEGLIKKVGLSSHMTSDELDEVLTKHPEVDFVQLQINYVDWESKSVESRLSYEVARKHGKEVVIMEPVKGGSLVKLPQQVADIFTQANPKASLASWAIRYAASLDGIITVLSGMSTIEQVEDNISYMEDFKPLNVSEYQVINAALEELNKIPQIPCTDCKYCVDNCPSKINIPNLFTVMNNYKIYQDLKRYKGSYDFNVGSGGKACECVKCGLCESACPQNIKIIEELAEISILFD